MKAAQLCLAWLRTRKGGTATFFRFLAAVLGGSMVVACSPGVDEIRWSEEVQLHDGRIITLERRAFVGSSGFPVEHRGRMSSWELCYPPLKVYWKSNDPFQPSHFEVAKGTAYVKVPMRGCESCTVTNNPENSTLYYVLRNGEWRRINSAEFPDKRWQNLLMNGIVNARDKKGDIRGHIAFADRGRYDRVTEDTDYGRIVMKEQLTRCQTCGGMKTDLKLEVSATRNDPDDPFCR